MMDRLKLDIKVTFDLQYEVFLCTMYDILKPR